MLSPDESSFKHLRWALLKKPDRLSDAEKTLLSVAFRNSSALRKAYEMRSHLKVTFDTDLTKKEAFVEVTLWEEKARNLGNKLMNSFLKTFTNWKDKVLNFFHNRLTNAVVEGLNNAIRGIIRRSFGFRDFDNLRQ